MPKTRSLAIYQDEAGLRVSGADRRLIGSGLRNGTHLSSPIDIDIDSFICRYR